MDKGRVDAFSDGVLAVAITLLVLDLHVQRGHGTLAHQLREAWPSYAAYVVSFLVIGVIWVNHHVLFSLVARVDRVLLFENLLLLMFVTTMPFTTSTLAEYVREGGADARWAVVLYGISNIGMAVAFTAMLSRMVHHGLSSTTRDPGRRQEGRAALRVRHHRLPDCHGAWPALAAVDPDRNQGADGLRHCRPDPNHAGRVQTPELGDDVACFERQPDRLGRRRPTLLVSSKYARLQDPVDFDGCTSPTRVPTKRSTTGRRCPVADR